MNFKAGQRQISAGALNAMVGGIRDLQRIGGGEGGSYPPQLVKSEAAIAVGAKGSVIRVYWHDTDTDTDELAHFHEVGEAFDAVNAGPDDIAVDEYAILIGNCGLFPCFTHTHPAPATPQSWVGYLRVAASADIAGYKLLSTSSGSAATYLAATITGTNQLIEEWGTAANSPDLTLLTAGEINVHIHARKASGTKTSTIYAKIYKRVVAVETLLTTTEASTALTATVAPYDLRAAIAENVLNDTDRIVVKFYATLTGLGTNAVVELHYDGDDVSSIRLGGIPGGAAGVTLANNTGVISSETAVVGAAATGKRSDAADGLLLRKNSAPGADPISGIMFGSASSGAQIRIALAADEDAERAATPNAYPTIEIVPGATSDGGVQAKVSATAGNTLTVDSGGLYVPTPSGGTFVPVDGAVIGSFTSDDDWHTKDLSATYPSAKAFLVGVHLTTADAQFRYPGYSSGYYPIALVSVDFNNMTIPASGGTFDYYQATGGAIAVYILGYWT